MGLRTLVFAGVLLLPAALAHGAEPGDGRRPNVLMIIADDLNEWTNLAEMPDLAAVKAELAAWLPKTDAPSLRGKAKRAKGRDTQ